MNERHAIVVGAGIVGVCCAAALARAGWRVSLLDPEPPGSRTSFGNAGGIATAEVIPLALPGVWRNVPGWLLDPLGPLALRWRFLPRLLPWFLRFLWASRPAAVERITTAAAALMTHVGADYAPLVAAAGLGTLWRAEGAITPYRDRAGYARDAHEWALRRRFGVRAELLGAAALRALEPALREGFECGVFAPDWAHVADPYAFTQGLAAAACRDGVALRRARVVAVEQRDGRASGVRTEHGEFVAADHVVIATGVWSAPFAAVCGHRVPLEAERGYHVTLPAADVGLKKFLLSPTGGFVVLPMDGGLRVAGTAEYARLDAPMDERRARVLIERAQSLLGPLNAEGARLWMGSRPSLPDYVPVISGTPACRGLSFAFGHGHLGLTLAATTGRLVAALADGRDPGIDLRPYRIDRF